ncbi:MAG: efflux RND transporter periplasmic adaptor subunit [Bacteroidota bacterium]
MDTQLTRPNYSVKSIYLGGAILLFGLAAFWMVKQYDASTIVVDADRLTLAAVVRSPFYEYINLTGNVEPASTFFIDSRIAGNVEQVYTESGQSIQVGDTLLSLANADLELEVMQREAQLIEQLNTQRQTALLLNQNYLSQQTQLVEVDYELGLMHKQFQRNKQLFQDSLLAAADFEPIADRYFFLQKRQQLLLQSFRADSLARTVQIQQIQDAEERILENLSAIRKILNRLHVIAVVSGQLGNFTAQVGQAFDSGDRLGEIYSLAQPTIATEVDEYYLEKVTQGQRGIATINRDTFGLQVEKIFPTIEDGRFRVELRFTDTAKELPKLVRGQSFRVRLLFGEATETTLLANGNFYNSTGGDWVYVINGDQASRQYVKLGRKNPRFYEVLEGLSPGDQVITSSYDNFKTYKTIKFN